MRSRIALTALAAFFSLGVAHAQNAEMLPGMIMPDDTRMVIPMLNVLFSLNTAGYRLMESSTGEMGNEAKFFAVNPETGMVMSLHLEFTTEKGDAFAAREHYWTKMQRSPLKKADIELSEIDGVPIVTHTVVEAQGQTLSQRNYNAYWSRNNVWIDLHLSKMNATPEDDELFLATIRSAELGPSR
ncbi:MAG TPA: hypothetical protein VNA88_15635 [Candidatus Kapabacteria bacterium]|jgi:hypothetical protein|nr:hypothetical protein [Candidatus Kapabacteria bacterium]